MDNRFTRKEVKCPLIGDKFCERDDKDCCICIGDEKNWQEEQCREEMKNENIHHKKVPKRNIQCIRCVNRKTRSCMDMDRLLIRHCELFIPRTEETGFDN